MLVYLMGPFTYLTLYFILRDCNIIFVLATLIKLGFFTSCFLFIYVFAYHYDE